MFPPKTPTSCRVITSYIPLSFHNKSHISTMKTLNHVPANSTCKAKSSDDDDSRTKPNPKNRKIPKFKFDRRGFLLLGFGSSGFYSTVSNLIPLSPDFVNCDDAVKPDGEPINCCPTPGPPLVSEITDFIPSAAAAAIRVRSAIQSADGGLTMVKYRKAVELMKQLPADDPRSFMQQANVHCAYCNGAYYQQGFPDLKFEIHKSWLFFPFHRLYLYFFERICAKLLNDQTFALPFWNWDSPSGMEIPAMFNVADSPLYDGRRDQGHLPPAVADLNFDDDGSDPTDLTREEQIKYNLSVMYKQMITNGSTPRLFMGQPFKTGDDTNTVNGAGSIEVAPHNTLHTWTGDPREPNRENMGTFYSAARDPIFYAHHANIDRLWEVWVNKLDGKVFSDSDWLETSFVFYNEDKKLVRVKVKDCLDLTGLGYTYQEVENPWLYAKPRPHHPKSVIRLQYYKDTPDHEVSEEAIWPKTLGDEVLNIIIRRPRRSRSKREKEAAEEVLLIEDIEYDIGQYVKFDVYVNIGDDVDLCTPESTEFLGSFVSVPHGRRRDHDVDDTTKHARGSQRFGISNVLVELGVDGDEVLLVTLVPRRGRVTNIGGIKIEFDASKSSP
ncbi:hypothetical protein OROHE_014713 [Orobanche hederae]